VASSRKARKAADPRIERSRRAILEAALEELGEVGYGAFAIESVAGRAGVAKSTLYRHWPDKLALVSAAFETFHAQAGPDLQGADARERVERIVQHVAALVSDSVFSRCIPALIDGAERDRALRKFHQQFQRHARLPLVAAIAAGISERQFAAHLDAERAAQALLGVIFYARLMSGESVRPEAAAELVNALLGPSPRKAKRAAKAPAGA
jgi:AcrR family transcriptional regulator